MLDTVMPGVSHDLAIQRKNLIHDLKYDLEVSIPESPQEMATGKVKIHLRLDEKPEELVIDYALPENIKSVSKRYRAVNQHIIIPKADLKVGNNEIVITFSIPPRWLNRRDDFLYTLSVPDKSRYLFPCFDQPDLKGVFNLKLTIPEKWECVANSSVVKQVSAKGGMTQYTFAPTLPLSSYLFSFVAGEFNTVSATENGKTVTLYHKESDPAYTDQCQEILRQVFASIKWMEEYTGISMPFPKYDLVIVPGFQFGGMEHVGAILYNDKMLFLPEHATIEQELSRTSIIAHETAHLWFGDYVTMDWFNEVWIKEVYANYFAALIAHPLYPEINHSLHFMLEHAPAAYSEDRTPGSYPIQQNLSNLQDAGMIYGNIIYYKSPMVMDAMIKLMGKEAFHEGIREYLSCYPYGNATFDNLVEKFDNHTDADLKSWCRTWVYDKGMPQINVTVGTEGVTLKGDGTARPQRVQLRIDDAIEECYVTDEGCTIATANKPKLVAVNYDGASYGYFAIDSSYIDAALAHISAMDENGRGATLINAYEATIRHDYYYKEFIRHITGFIITEPNSLLYGRALSYLESVRALHPDEQCDAMLENSLLEIIRDSKDESRRIAALRTLSRVMDSQEAIEAVYHLWNGDSDITFTPGEVDAVALSYQLAIRLPERADEIVATQRKRLSSENLLQEYDFVAPSVAPSQATRDSVFNALLKVENRSVEPWVRSALANLNHRCRRAEAVKYLLPGLDVLEEIKQTGDIFFPKSWLMSLFAGHDQRDIDDAIDTFLTAHPDYPEMLRNKVLFFRSR
jgi:aminopeptidase N